VAEATGDRVRYKMLEPVRQYGWERLEASGEADAVQQQQAAFFLRLAEAADPELRGAQQAMWMEHLEIEHDNLRAALGWSLEHSGELGLRLAGALWRFWFARGYLSEGRRWLENGLARNGPGCGPVRAKALNAVGWLVKAQGEYKRARALHEESLGLYRRLGDREGIATSFNNLGTVALSLGEHERATAELEESLALFRELGDERGMAPVLNHLGALASARGDTARALVLYEEALASSRKVGSMQNVATALGNLGYTTLVYGDRQRATALLEESLALFQELGDMVDIAICLVNLGLAVLTQGDHERAGALIEESLAIACEIRSKNITIDCLEAMVVLAGARSQVHRAAQLWGAAQALREDIGTDLAVDERALLEPYVVALRSLLNEASWEAAVTEGKAMTAEQAVEYALSEEELTSHAPEQPLADEPPVALTRREREVATLVARGLTNRQIASELVVSERTVDHHVSNILKKLNLRSREQVVSRLGDR
jgi:DNA-binding NarL/FixJ family response regulator